LRHSVYDKSSKPSGDEMKPANIGEDSIGPRILYDEFEKALQTEKWESSWYWWRTSRNYECTRAY